ncbi:MAG: cell wall-binding repeat-containing protein, partial [Acidimicrobiales bacterium]
MDRAVRRRPFPRRAAVAALTGVAMLGAMAGPSGAITGGAILVGVSQPTLGVGQTNQLAGNLTITPNTPLNTFAVSEQIVVRVDDADGAPNCSPTPPASVSSDFVAFSAVPTVTVSGTATLAATTIRPQPASLCATEAKSNEVVITFATAGTATLTIANVRYDVGSGAASGAVQLVVTTSAVDLITVAVAPNNSNATLTTVNLTGNTPPVGLRAGSGIQGISNLVLSEQIVDALATGSTTQTVCIRLDTPSDIFDATAPLPTVTASPASGDTATLVLAEANRSIEVAIKDVSNTDTAASTFTISGVRVGPATTATTGHITASVFVGTCAVPPLAFVSNIVLGGVVDTERFAGSDRFTTAQILFEDAFSCAPVTGLATAIIARSDAFPDALAASYLAGVNNTGILLVDPSSGTIPPPTVNALRNRGVDRVIIIGGTVAVPAVLATALDALPNVNCLGVTEATPNDTIAVTRIEGDTRYQTAQRVAEQPGLGVAGTADYDGTAADPDGPACAPRKTAVLATGENFPDAVVAGPVAYEGVPAFTNPCGNNGGFPLILTTGNALHPDAAAALTNLGIQQVLIMGG